MKIIVLVDCQNDFITGPLGSQDAALAADNIVKYLRGYNEGEALVLYTKDTHQENYLDTAEGKKLPVKHCIEGTPGWSIYKDISSEVDYSTKFYSYSSFTVRQGRILKETFGSKELVRIIQELAAEYFVEGVIFAGFCTDICVVSNVLMTKAAVPETKISVLVDCCAGSTPQNHCNALAIMNSCQIDLVEGNND